MLSLQAVPVHANRNPISIVPITPDLVDEFGPKGWRNMFSAPRPLEAPKMSEVFDGVVVDASRQYLAITHSQAESIVSAVPLSISAGETAIRYVLSTGEQAVVLDVVRNVGTVSVAISFAPTVTGHGVLHQNFVTTSVEQLAEDRLHATWASDDGQFEGDVVYPAAPNRSASQADQVTCPNGCALLGAGISIAGAVACAVLVTGGSVVPVIGTIAGGILCGVIFGIGGTSAGIACSAECVVQNGGDIEFDHVICDNTGCGVSLHSAVINASVVDDGMLVTWQRLRERTFIHTSHTLSTALIGDANGVRSYKHGGLAYGNTGVSVACTAIVDFFGWASLSNGSSLVANMTSGKPFPAYC